MALEAGTRIGKFTIVRLVAQGGMAEVYRAEQELAEDIKRPAALKVIRPEYSESKDFRQMFLDEARTACTLSHANIVHIYEVGESEEGQLYMAMELVTGETLATINRTLREHGDKFSLDAIFSIGISTCRALDAVHALKVEGGSVNLVHRDVSPHNLLLSASGTLKLIDFGIAKAATNQNLTMPGVTKGKAGYFSPEQALGKKLDGRSDIFSVGVTLYKLITGSTPFDEHKTHLERNTALVKGEWKSLRDAEPGLPESLYEIVDKAMQVQPEARYQTADEMREALEAAAFDAGMRTGPSALTGYVDVDGEITATAKRAQSGQVRAISGSSKHRALIPPPGPTAPNIPPTQVHTDKIPARQKPSEGPPLMLMLLAFVIAVALGVIGIFIATSGEPERPQPGDIRVVNDEPAKPPVPVQVVSVTNPPIEPPPEVPDAAVTVEADPPPETPGIDVKPGVPLDGSDFLKPKPPVVPQKVEPKVAVVVQPRPDKNPVVTPISEPIPTVERTFEPGTAKLRLTPSDIIESVQVDGVAADNFLNIPVQSGLHQLIIKLNTGKTVNQKCGLQPGPQVVRIDPSTGRLSGC